jgi:hypothetical protein
MPCKLPLLLGTILLLSLLASAQGEGDLETIRTDVRTAPPESAAPPSSGERSSSHDSHCDAAGREQLDNAEGSLVLAGFYVGAYAVATPFWLPRAIMDDNSNVAYFPRFPYDNTPGYLESDAWLSGFTAENAFADAQAGGIGSPPSASNGPGGGPPKGELVTLSNDPSVRRWAGQFRADYADNFGHLSGVGGELILETTSRFGIDTSFQYLTERLPGAADDHLTIGDCNLIYRFAQSARAQMRAGIGANWLNDSTRTDAGFNFTYGGDFFPRKPWVLSSAIDWGTLGHAGLFRFRSTVGVIVNRFEGYVGYEYLDIGSTQDNFLIGGVRVWF